MDGAVARRHPRPRQFLQGATACCALLVGLVSVLPFLSILPGYFLADDFGVVGLLARQPPLHFLSLFTMPWTESIYGVPADELRPTVALAFQFSSQWGASAPMPYHLTAIAFHVLNTLLVLAIARAVARLGLLASTFAGMLFAVLPIHAESVAWLQGLSDSIPTFFYLAVFLLYALWRRTSTATLYWGACGLFFLALFSKQTAITMLVTLVMYDVLVEHQGVRPSWSMVGPYAPFLFLTSGYLVLRYIIFGQAVRENQATLGTLTYFGEVQIVALQTFIFGTPLLSGGNVTAELRRAASIAGAGLGVLGILSVLLIARAKLRGSAEERRRTLCGSLLYFGPVWWLISTAPLIVTYHSPRHLYLAAAGVAVAFGIGVNALWLSPRRLWQYTGVVGGALVILAAVILLQRPLAEWNIAAAVSRGIVRDVDREAATTPGGTLLVLGAPQFRTPSGGWGGRTFVWSWALPFAVRPPFTQTDLTEHVYIIERPEVYCCPLSQWFTHVRTSVQAWSRQPDTTPATIMLWNASTGALIRQSDSEAPSLRSQLLSLLDSDRPEDMQQRLDAILRQLDER